MNTEIKSQALDALELLIKYGVQVTELRLLPDGPHKGQFYIKCIVPEEKHPMIVLSDRGLWDLIDTAITTIRIGCPICNKRKAKKLADKFFVTTGSIIQDVPGAIKPERYKI